MGFRIELDNNASAVLAKLRSEPWSVFGRPYAGYLLILATTTEIETLRSLADGFAQLDSLTGDYIAFALFTQRVRVQVRVPYFGAPRPPRLIGNNSLDEWSHLSLIAKKGRFGQIANGDEIDLVSPAVDVIARELSIVRDLPCIVALDAFPSPDVPVLPLKQTPDAVIHLVKLLREVIQEMLDASSWLAYLAQLEEIGRLERTLTNYRIEHEETSRSLARRSQLGFITERITALVRSADIERLRRELENYEVYAPDLLAHTEAHRERLSKLNRTVEVLIRFRDADWPLRERTARGYRDVCKIYAAEFLSEISEGEAPSLMQCMDLIDVVNQHQATLVYEILRSLPDLHALEASHRAALEQRVTDLESQIPATIEQLTNAIRSNLSDDQPRFTEVLKRVVKRQNYSMKLQSLRNAGGALLGKLTDPTILMEAWKLATGT